MPNATEVITPQVEDRASIQLSAEPTSAARSRAWIVEALTAWGAQHLLETAALLTDELVVNAVRHARTPMLLSARWRDGQLRVDVTDACPAPPVRLHVPSDASAGRGLNLVATLASRWGVERHAGGKTVWFETR